MRKSIRIIAITVCLISIATTLFAEWQQQYPRIAGGPLTSRSATEMVSMGNGRILLFGGINGSTFLGDTWILEINKSRWMRIAPTMIGGTISARHSHGMAYLGWESVLLFGGRLTDTATWLYSYITNSWTKLSPTVVGGSLGSDSQQIGMCYIDEGRVLMFGGSVNGTRVSNTWVYDSGLNRWELKTPTIVGQGFVNRSAMGMAYIGNGRALIFGGTTTGTEFLNDTWVYDLGQNQWTRMTPVVVAPAGNGLTGRQFPGMAYIGGDQVLLFGGRLNTSNLKTNEIWMYDLSDNQWTQLPNLGSNTLPTEREDMGFASAGLGQAVMFGGNAGSSMGDTWRFSIPENIHSSVAWQVTPGGIQLDWDLPEEWNDAQFSIYRDGVQISPSVSPGTAVDGTIPFTFIDPSPAPNKIYRYQIKEHYPIINSELFYPEIGVPYCQ